MAGDGVKVNLPSLRTLIPDSTRIAILKRAAASTVGIIKRRTARGVDVDGAPFKPYSPGYAKQLEAAGQGSSAPDLWLTGGMLGSMTVLSVDATKAIVGFQGASPQVKFRKANRTSKRTGKKLTKTASRSTKTVSNAMKAAAHHKGLGKNPKRRFFDLSPQERLEVITEAQRTLRGR